MKSPQGTDKQNSFRKSRGLQIVSNTRTHTPDRLAISSSVKHANNATIVHNNDSKQKPKQNLQLYQHSQSNHNYAFVIDYQNARYQGKISSSVTNGKTTKVVKDGPGILVDDQINFLFSNWKNNLLNDKTVLIDRLGNYFYSKWNSQSANPVGHAFLRIGSLLLLIKFSQKTGAWNMTEPQQGNTIIAIDERNYSLVVLRGKIQQVSSQFKCSKSSPLSVVQFACFASQNQQRPNVQSILLTYAQKYGYKLEDSEMSLSNFLQSITTDIRANPQNSKQFSFSVTKNLLNNVFTHHSNDNKPNKQNYETYEKQKQKLYDQKFIVFRECKSSTNKIKQSSFYFGFLNGLGLKFKQEQSTQFKSNGSQKEKSFRLKSIGNHNHEMKIEDIGAKFYDNKCIEEGNFKTKNTCTYENPLFRPTNKLVSIYNRYHKQQSTFLNEFFDKNQLSIFKLMSSLQTFVNDHVLYIMNECFIETTKFNEKEEKEELVEKVLLKNYNKKTITSQPAAVEPKHKSPAYEVQIQRKSRLKNAEDYKNQALAALKDKNSELKEKIKKVKYEIEYLPPEGQNMVIMKDDKFMSKIKKHLYSYKQENSNVKNRTQRSQNNSKIGRSRSKSCVEQRSRSRRTYIQKDKPKVASPTKHKNSSPVKKGVVDDSLDKIDNLFDRNMKASKSKSRPKTEAELLLERINHNIEFRQKFNYGIQFNVENEYCSKKEKKKKESPAKNRYNGRSRFFTDNQLDNAIDHHLSTSSQVTVKSITPGKRIKKKQQARHFIYSNVNRNTNNQEEKYENQKETEQAIRAEILGISLEEYRKRAQYQKQKQAYMEENFLKLVEEEESLLRVSEIRLLQQESQLIRSSNLRRTSEQRQTLRASQTRRISQDIPDQNQTFGAGPNDTLKFSPSRIHKISGQNLTKSMSFLQSMNKQEIQQIKSIYEDPMYCPKPKQQSLVEKRMRILQDYKELNGRKQQDESLSMPYIPIYNNNLRARDTLPPNFREYSPNDFKKEKHYDNLPVYKEQAGRKVLSPLKAMIQNRQNTHIMPYGKSSYINLETRGGRYGTKEERLVREEVQKIYEKSKSKERNEPVLFSFSSSQAAKGIARKYQYYFD